MNILFIHQNFPGQFKHLAPALVSAGHDVTALTLATNKLQYWLGVRLIPYSLTRANTKDVHPWVLDFESKVIRAEACLKAADALRNSGYRPDIIISHPGWGESLFLKDIWPDAKLKIYCEFFYHAHGLDVGFDKEFPTTSSIDFARVNLKNANILLHFEQADEGLSPTNWQASTFPKHIRDRISVIHDGIDTKIIKPYPAVSFTLDTGKKFTRKDEIITFVNRTLEPYRGFHIFMRSLPKILSGKPNAQVIIVGKEGVGYGTQPPNKSSWKTQFSEEVMPLLTAQQRERIHFIKYLDYARYLNLLQVSRVHVYLTYPFVLSWSLIEAMSAGCAIIASDTQPLQEAIKHDQTGKLFDFFDPSALADSALRLLENEDERSRLGKAAREFAKTNYDLSEHCLPRQIQWVIR
jgi:glycosyltransferase involved in cell wall biosynthesis